MNRQKFKGLYTSKGYTLESLAKKIDMTSPTLIKKLKDDSLTIRDVVKISEALNLSQSEREELFYLDLSVEKK